MRLAHSIVGPQDASALVLLHGITESSGSWDPIVERLRATYRVVTVDLRGHGESPLGEAYDPVSYATDVVETVASAGIERPVVIGHSLGGVVASAVAAISPVGGVINVDQPLRLSGFKDSLTQLEPMLRGSDAEFRQAIDMVFLMMEGPLADPERTRIRSLRHPTQSVVLGTWESVFTSTPEELDATVGALAGAIHVPYLSLHGIDPGPEYSPWLTSLLPTATVETWGEQGHYPHLIDPARFVARVDSFVASLP